MENEIKKTGHCKHGEFVLLEGCPQCIAEAKAEREELQVAGRRSAAQEAERTGTIPKDTNVLPMDADEPEPPVSLVKVRYYSQTTGALSPREYTYFTAEPLALGDVVKVPVQDRIGKAKVTAVNVPEAEVAAFRDKVKTIPAGSIISEPVPPPAIDPANPPDPGPYGVQEWPQEPPAGDGIKPVVAVIKINPEYDADIVKLYQEGITLLDYATARVITTNEDLKPAVEDLGTIAKLKKALGDYKTEYVGPIRERLDKVNAAFVNLLAPFEEADQITRGQVKTFRDEQARKVAEAQAIEDDKLALARREEELTGEHTVELGTAVAPPPAPDRVFTGQGTQGFVKVYKWEVVDKAAVPEEYKKVDAGKVGADIKASKGTLTIPGIRTWTDESVRVNTR